MLYLTFRQYRYVVAVAEAGSLTKAAALLHVSQPSLYVALTRVEERLGRSIFVRRKGTAIVVTPFGYRFVDQARELLRVAAKIEQGASADTPFVVGCFEDIAPWYLAPALGKLKARFPSMTFQGKEGRFSSLASDLIQGRADLAISYDIGFHSDFKRRKLTQVTPVAFVSTNHPIAGQTSIELEQLLIHPLILSAEGLSEEYMLNLFEQQNLNAQIAHNTVSLEMMRSLAAHGAGIGISYSKPPVDMSYDGKPLVTVPISTPEAVADIIMIWSGLYEPNPQFTEVLDAIKSF